MVRAERASAAASSTARNAPSLDPFMDMALWRCATFGPRMVRPRCMPPTRRESSPYSRGGSFRRSLFITVLLMCGVAVAAQELDEEMKYSARDSMRYDLQQQTCTSSVPPRWSTAISSSRRTASSYRLQERRGPAFGAPDSTGAVAGNRCSSQSDHRIEADSIRYNFRSKKGLIKEVRTSEQESYVQARVSKRHANGKVHSKGGMLTTCDRPHPHYHFAREPHDGDPGRQDRERCPR
jgi:hypothetical protein